MISTLAAIIVTSDIFAAAMLFIVLLGVLAEKNKSIRHSAFIGCLIGTIICLCFEVFNYTLNGNLKYTPLLYVTNCGVNVIGDIVIFLLKKYCFDCVNEKRKTSKIPIYIVGFVCAADIIIQIIGAYTGFTFTMENGYFKDYYMYTFSTIVSLTCYVTILIYLIRNYKYIGKHLFRVFILFYVCPITSVIVVMIEPRYYFVLQSLAVSFLIIYIGIEKQERENLLSILANEDTLTGLKNRNSWNKKYEEILSKNTRIGILYADLNNLKYTNDNLGHLAGDELIKNFTAILNGVFKTDEVYRIGGDEFVLYFDKGLDNMPSKIEKFKKVIFENNRMGSFGYEEGDSSNLEEIIKKAEAEMYKDKKDYYKTSGTDRRRRVA